MSAIKLTKSDERDNLFVRIVQKAVFIRDNKAAIIAARYILVGPKQAQLSSAKPGRTELFASSLTLRA